MTNLGQREMRCDVILVNSKTCQKNTAVRFLYEDIHVRAKIHGSDTDHLRVVFIWGRE